MVQERLEKAAAQKTTLEQEVRKVNARFQEVESSLSSCELARRTVENNLQKTVAELAGKESQILVNYREFPAIKFTFTRHRKTANLFVTSLCSEVALKRGTGLEQGFSCLRLPLNA